MGHRKPRKKQQMDLPIHIADAISEYTPHQNGWTTVERASEMAACILETKAKVIVDIGVFAGRSTVAMGFAARELGDAMVFGIDPWKIESATEGEADEASADWWRSKADLERMHRECMQWVWDHRLDQWVTIIRAASQHVHQLFPTIDFLNIDGQHAEIASCRDVQLYLPKLKSGHYVTFDDTDWAQTQKAVQMIEAECDLVSDNGKARTYRKR